MLSDFYKPKTKFENFLQIIENGNQDQFEQMLLENPDFINQEDNASNTALMVAISCAQVGFANTLIDNGADIHRKDNYNSSMLTALANGLGRYHENRTMDDALELARRLITAGIDIHHRCYGGFNALDFAYDHGENIGSALRLLLESITSISGFQFSNMITDENELSASQRERLELIKCPISCDIMDEPITLSTGITYERSHIKQYTEGKIKDREPILCPVTKKPFLADEPEKTVTNIVIKSLVANFLEEIRVLVADRKNIETQQDNTTPRNRGI